MNLNCQHFRAHWLRDCRCFLPTDHLVPIQMKSPAADAPSLREATMTHTENQINPARGGRLWGGLM